MKYALLAILLLTNAFCINTDIYNDSHALIIGINEYENTMSLNYAANDAKAIQSILINQFNFPKKNVSILLDEQATLNNIRKEFSRISKYAKTNDRVLIYFAGHGQTMNLPGGGVKGYLLPYEADENELYLTSLAMNELEEISLMSKAKHILFLIDACYGGIATVAYRGLNVSETPNYINKITKNIGRQIITAGGKDERVIEKAKWGHSAFTKNILNALKFGNGDLNNDNFITANELAIYISDKVTIDSDNQQTPQYTRMTTDEGEFVFMINVNSNDKDNNQLTYAELLKQNQELEAKLQHLKNLQELGDW